MKWHNETEEELREAAKKAKSIAEMCRLLERNQNGGGYYIMKKKIKELNIDISHFVGQGWNTSGKNLKKNKIISDAEVFKENSEYQSNRLRKRLVEGGYREDKCEKCGITEWQGQPISLQVHHINGIRDDNRLENLQILCPNCHSQTDNFGSKNIKRIRTVASEKKKNFKKICAFCGKIFYSDRSRTKYCSKECMRKGLTKMPDEKELKKMLEEYSVSFIAKLYNVNRNTVRKWRKKIAP